MQLTGLPGYSVKYISCFMTCFIAFDNFNDLHCLSIQGKKK